MQVLDVEMISPGEEQRTFASDAVDVDSLDIPDWLKDGLKKLDLDGDGLEKEEIDEMLSRVAEEKRMAKNNIEEIHYNHMPEKVQEVMRMWDHDLSGSVSVSELTAAAKAQEKLQQENRIVKRLLFASVIVIILLAVLNFAMSLAAVESGKDFTPKKTASGARRLSMDGRMEGRTGGGKGALADGDTLIGTVVPMDTYTDMKDFNRAKPGKEMLDSIRTYAFYDPDVGTMSNRKIKKAEFIEGDLIMFDSNGNELTITEDGTTIETKPDGGSRVVLDKKPNGLLEPRDAGKKEMTLEALPEQPQLPEGDFVPTMIDHCPLNDGEEECDKDGLKGYIKAMFESKGKGGITGDEPEPAAVDDFFLAADCDRDGFVSKGDIQLAENQIPCGGSRRVLRELSMAHRPYGVRRMEAQRLLLLRQLQTASPGSFMSEVGPPANCVPVIENAHILLNDNNSTRYLPRKKRGPAMAKLLSLDSNKDGCVDNEEHAALKMEHLQGARPLDCSKVKPPRSCRCLPDGVESIKLWNAKNLLPQCVRKFHKLDRDHNGEVTRKECEEGSASKSEDDFFKILQYDGNCPQNTGFVGMQAFIDFKVGEKGEHPVKAEIYAKVADMDGDGFLDMVEAAATPASILNDLHGNYTDEPERPDKRSLRKSRTGRKRRLRLIRTLMKPRIAARAHAREQRRLQRELTIRGRMLQKVGTTHYGQWLEERIEIGSTRRRLSARWKDELLKEDFVAMKTEELETNVRSWEESGRYRALQMRFGSGIPPSTRRLLGITAPAIGRELQETTAPPTPEDEALHDEITTLFSAIPPEAIEEFLDEHVEDMWDPAVKAQYEACPSPFFLHRGEDLEVDDVNAVHDYPTGVHILAGAGAVDAVADALGCTHEQAEHKIMHLYGPPGTDGDKGRRQRVRRLAELDPLHRRRLRGGEFGNVDPMNDVVPLPSLDQCEFLMVTDRQQYDKLMSDPNAQLAYFQGAPDPCYAALDPARRALHGMPEPRRLDTGETVNCIMPSNSYVDPSTHQVLADDPQGTIAPFQFAAAQTLHAPACAELPWEEKIMPTTEDSITGRVSRDSQSPYAKNWEHDTPGKGCALTCCKTGNEYDCAGDQLLKDCECLKEKKKCMRHTTDKLITADVGGSGMARRRQRRLQRRLARKHVVAERRRRRRLDRLLPFERRRLMVQDRAVRMERRRLDEAFDEMRNADGSHNFCSMHNGYPDYCRWDFGCTVLDSQMAGECAPCSVATSASDCTGSCAFVNGVCGVPDECLGLLESDCEMTVGCAFVSSSCRGCSTLIPRYCAGPGCRLNGERVCVVNDFHEDGPSGHEFNDDCPLRTTTMEAACALDSTLACSAGGTPPTAAQLKASYDGMTNATRNLLKEMTSAGISFETREVIVEHITVQAHPIDYDDIDFLDASNPRRLQMKGRHLNSVELALDSNSLSRRAQAASMAGAVNVPILDSSMYATEDTFAYVSTNGHTLSSTDAEEFLTQCGAPSQDAPASGETKDNFCEEISHVDTAMRAMGNDAYEVEFHEAHELVENSLADHLADIAGGDSGGIDRPTHMCACTQELHMSRGECTQHYDDMVDNGVNGMSWEEFIIPPPALWAVSEAEEQPLTPDAEYDHAMGYSLFEHHDGCIDRIEMSAESLFWYIYGAAHTNNIVRRQRRLIAGKDLESEFDMEDAAPPVCDPVEVAEMTRSGFEFFQWEIEELRFAVTELDNFYAHNSTSRRLRGHFGHRRLQAMAASELQFETQHLLGKIDLALDTLDQQINEVTMDYEHLYTTPVEVLELVCIHLRPKNLPFRRKNVVAYDPQMFIDPMMPTEDPMTMCDNMKTGDTVWEDDFSMPPPPNIGEPINLHDLNPMPEPTFEMPAPSRCEDPDKCHWQGEDPFLFTETRISTGTPIAKAMRWTTAVDDEADRIDPAAARMMETHAWPWESTMDEFVESMEMVSSAVDDPTTRSKREERMRKTNSDAADPIAATDLTMTEVEEPKSHAQLEGLFRAIALPGLDVVPHPIPPEDARAPQEACKQYAGVDSGLEIGSVNSAGTFLSGAPVDFFNKCVQHRMQHRMFETVNDVRNSVANKKATATVTRRVRRRLAEEHGGEDNFPSHVRRLFAHPDEQVHPLTFARKHKVHRQRTSRTHARRLRVQQDDRRRALRRRLESGDESIVVPTMDHDLAPSVLDRLLLGKAEEDGALLANAGKQRLMAEFETEVRGEMLNLKGTAVMSELILDDFKYLVKEMHNYYAAFEETSVGNTGNAADCLEYDPDFEDPIIVPVVDQKVSLSANAKNTFERCSEPFHSGVPEEALYFADKVKNGEIGMERYFEEAFHGELPTELDVVGAQEQEHSIYRNQAQFPNTCYCECKQKAIYEKVISAGCLVNPTIDGTLSLKTVCEIIADAKMVDKQKNCAPNTLSARRLEDSEPVCITVNGEQYCKPGKATRRQLSTRRHPGRKLQAMRRQLRRQTKQVRGKARKMRKPVRRAMSQAITKKTKRRTASRKQKC